MNNKHLVGSVLPVLFGFFIMGFCDVVGITAMHVKEELLGSYSTEFRDTLSNLIPVALFSMFLIFSVPTGLLMNRIGRKNTVLLSNTITIVAMLIPLISYNFPMILLAFALLGIANTILQVSLNPLLTNVVQAQSLTSILTAGQFIKAISSFSGPFIAVFATRWLGSWQFIFPIYAFVTLLSSIWLMATAIDTETINNRASTYSDVFGLLKNKTIILLFLGIVLVVGLDVGVNTSAPKILMERCGLSVMEAGYGPSIYFAFRTAGAFLGAFLLTKYSAQKIFKIITVLSVVSLVIMIFAEDKFLLYALLALIGLSIANVFSIIFSFALQAMPNKANEISGLMITGVFGGALIPFLMGIVSDYANSQIGAILIILFCSFYLLLYAFYQKPKERV